MPDKKPAGVRLAKLLAQRGVAARRKAEELIAAGRVLVNGEVAEVVTFVDPERDEIEVDGRKLPGAPEKSYYVLYKPPGYITTRSDPQGRKSVLELTTQLPVRVETVGRLDFDTEGALLLTNDGHLAHALTHPSSQVPKVYRALVKGKPGPEVIQAIERGVELNDGPTAPAKARLMAEERDNRWIQVTVHEGRNRLIRRLMLTLGHPVIELHRQSFAGIDVRGLDRGKARELTPAEVRSLRALASGEAKSRRKPVEQSPERRSSPERGERSGKRGSRPAGTASGPSRRRSGPPRAGPAKRKPGPGKRTAGPRNRGTGPRNRGTGPRKRGSGS